MQDDMMTFLSQMMNLGGQVQQLDAQEQQMGFQQQMQPLQVQQAQEALKHSQFMHPLMQQEAQFMGDRLESDYDLDRRGKEAKISQMLSSLILSMQFPEVKQYMSANHPGAGIPDMTQMVEEAKNADFQRAGIAELMKRFTAQPLTH